MPTLELRKIYFSHSSPCLPQCPLGLNPLQINDFVYIPPKITLLLLALAKAKRISVRV